MPRFAYAGLTPTLLLMLSGATAPPTQAQPISVEEAVDCREPAPMLDLGAIPAHFVANERQSDLDAEFTLPAFGDGLAAGPSGVSFGHDDRAVTQHFVDAMPAFAASADAVLGSETAVLGTDQTQVLANAAAIEAKAFLPGITLGLTSTHRVLTQTFEGEAGADPTAIEWRYDGALETLYSPGSGGHLRVRRHDGTYLEVRAAQAWQVSADGTPAAVETAYRVSADGVVGLTFGELDLRRPWTVETATLFAAGSTPYQAVRDGDGTVIATFTHGPTGRDLLVTALDAEATTLWSTIIAGDGDDEARAVAIDRDGSVLVAGATASSDLPGLASDGSGGSDGFVLRLSAGGREVVAATRVASAPGDDAAGALLVDEDGSILVGGQAEIAPSSTGRLSFAALVPTRPTESRPTYLLRVDADLSETLETSSFPSPVLDQIAVWRACHGKIVIGPPAVAAAGCGGWPNLTYAMEYKGEDYDLDHDWGSSVPGLGSPPGGWGYHALRWRFYQANDIAPIPPWTIDWSLAPISTPIPKASAICGDDDTLDTLETILYKQGGTTANPPNGWACLRHNSVQELALSAAFHSQRYDTPAYTHFGEWSNLGGPWVWGTFPVAIEETEWEVVCPFGPGSYNGEGLEDLCDFSSGWIGGINCAATVNGVVGGTMAQPFFLSAKTFETAAWLPMSWYGRGVDYDTDFAWWYEEFYEPADVVVDPPDDPNESLLVAEAVAQLGAFTTERQRVRLDIYESGKVTRSAEGTVAVPSTSLP